MYVDHIKNFKIDGITLISSLPDMGKVGGLVSQHITKRLDARVAIKITISDKPWINQKSGLVTVPHDEYTVSVDEKNKIVIFTGESQPQEPDTVIRLTELVFSEVKKIGYISKIISAGGYLPAQQGKGDEVFGVATNQKTLDNLKQNEILPLSSEVNSITWFNGLILGKAKDHDIDGIGLFGEIIDSNSPQYKAVSNIIKKIEKITNIDIGTTEIDEKIVEPPLEVKADNPGIG